MGSIRSNLSKLLYTFPIIVIYTIINVLIVSVVSGVVMIQIVAKGYPVLGLSLSIMTSIIVYSWLIFNHKIRAYIKNQGEL
jgi:hypothetical protein